MNTAQKRPAWQEKVRLERLGYEFEVHEEPISEPERTGHNVYFVVTVLFKGKALGTRTELTREQAMARALELADLHYKNPPAVDRKTLLQG